MVVERASAARVRKLLREFSWSGSSRRKDQPRRFDRHGPVRRRPLFKVPLPLGGRHWSIEVVGGRPVVRTYLWGPPERWRVTIFGPDDEHVVYEDELASRGRDSSPSGRLGRCLGRHENRGCWRRCPWY